MADKEHRQTDEILAEMEQHLSAIYEEASADIEAKAQEYFDRFKAQDEEMRKKVKSGEITEAEYIEWRRKKMLYGKRYTDMQRSLAEEISHVNETAMAYINDKLPTIYALNFNALKGAVESVVKGYSFSLVDPQVVKNLATRDKTLLPYKYVNGRKDVRWNTQKVNSAVLQGVLQGESVSDIGKRLQSVTEMNRTSAIRNARTTVTSAECKGRQDSYEQAAKDGIEIEREWIATNDMRTRHAHAFLNGKTAAVDEPFETPLQIGANLFITDRIMYPGDPEAHPANVYNCRCTIAAKVIGFNKVQVEKTMAEKQVEAPKPQEWDNLPDDVTDRATAIDKLLTEETGKKSVFNGKVVIDDSIKFNGTANYDGSITLRSKASRKTEIHELLHQHSEGGQNKVYVAIFKNIEEGSVELLAQEICHAKGIKIGQFDYSYTPYVDALRQINKLSGAYKTDYDFAKAVFGKPLEKRAEYLKSLGDGVAKDEKRFFRGALKTLGVK